MIKIKLFENFENFDKSNDIDFNKVKQDINDILVELIDDSKFEIEVHKSCLDEVDKYFQGIDLVDLIFVKISKLGSVDTFFVEDLKDYLDMMVDYMNIYYEYDMEFNYLPVYSSRWKFYDNYDLHLKEKVKSICIEFSNIKVKNKI